VEQLLAHLWGDYLLQSDWMANLKRQAWRPVIAHAGLYSIAFIWLTSSPLAWVVIFGTHLLIDRFGLARYLVWAKNWLGPAKPWYASSAVTDWTDNQLEIFPNDVYRINQPTPPFRACSATGYPPNRPAWLAVWLTIIADNTLHLTINYLALRYL